MTAPGTCSFRAGPARSAWSAMQAGGRDASARWRDHVSLPVPGRCVLHPSAMPPSAFGPALTRRRGR